MKRILKKHVAKIVVFAMVLTTVTGFTLVKEAKADEPLSEYLNMEYGIKYSGTTEAVPDEAGTAWNIQYFNVENSAYSEGDEFYVSCTFSGASEFQQIAMQSSVNDWNWDAAPKIWANTGVTDGTVVAGKITATADGDNLAFKMQFDHPIENPEPTADVENPEPAEDAEDPEPTADTETPQPVKITLSDLYIVKLGNDKAEATALPEDDQITLGAQYSGPVTANLNETQKDVYETQYFAVNDSAYAEGDTYVFSYTVEGANGFRQVVTQSNLNEWDWATSPKLWAGKGLAESQSFAGAITAVSSGDGVSFKIRVDSPVEESTEENPPADSIKLTITNLIVVKVVNDEILDLPETLQINKNRYYQGPVTAEYDEDTKSWNVQYFNVNNSSIEAGQKFEISFNVSGATEFQQLVVQSNVDGWEWDNAPKIYKEGGIPDKTKFDAIITATEDQNQITFKLWFDSLTEDGEKLIGTSPVDMTLNNLIITEVTSPEPEPTETPEPEPTETPEPTTEPEAVE